MVVSTVAHVCVWRDQRRSFSDGRAAFFPMDDCSGWPQFLSFFFMKWNSLFWLVLFLICKLPMQSCFDLVAIEFFQFPTDLSLLKSDFLSRPSFRRAVRFLVIYTWFVCSSSSQHSDVCCVQLQSSSAASIPAGSCLPGVPRPADLDIAPSSPQSDWMAGPPGRGWQTRVPRPPPSLSCSAVGSTSSLVLVSWHRNRLVMSGVTPPPTPHQPGATPSALFTLLPFTRSSCSSPNDAGPS